MIAFNNGWFSPSNGDKSDGEYMEFLTNLVDWDTNKVVPSHQLVSEEINHVLETGKGLHIHEVY